MEAKSRECRWNDPTHDSLLSPEAFAILLNYIYAGEASLNRITIPIAMEFLGADVCNYFGLANHHLMHYCRRFVQSVHQPLDDRRRSSSTCRLS